jgi:hypothetical protein
MELFILNAVRFTNKVKSLTRGFSSQAIKLSAFLFIVFYSLSLSAQGVQELNMALAAMKASSVKSVQDNSLRISSLVNEINPTIYINNGVIRTSHNTPSVCADVDIQSLNRLSESNSAYEQVELLKIRINEDDVSGVILNIGNLSSFTNLKYILFVCSYSCSPSSINSLYLSSADNGIAVYYQISIPN